MQTCHIIEDLLGPDIFALEIASVDIDGFAFVTLQLKGMNLLKVRSTHSPLGQMQGLEAPEQSDVEECRETCRREHLRRDAFPGRQDHRHGPDPPSGDYGRGGDQSSAPGGGEGEDRDEQRRAGLARPVNEPFLLCFFCLVHSFLFIFHFLLSYYSAAAWEEGERVASL